MLLMVLYIFITIFYYSLPFFDTITLGFCLFIIMPTTMEFVVPGQIELSAILITPKDIFANYLICIAIIVTIS